MMPPALKLWTPDRLRPAPTSVLSTAAIALAYAASAWFGMQLVIPPA